MTNRPSKRKRDREREAARRHARRAAIEREGAQLLTEVNGTVSMVRERREQEEHDRERNS